MSREGRYYMVHLFAGAEAEIEFSPRSALQVSCYKPSLKLRERLIKFPSWQVKNYVFRGK